MDLKRLLKFYDALQDEESRKLFMIKYDMLFHKTYGDFIETLIQLDYQWKIDLYDDFRPLLKNKKVIIFGAGPDGRMTCDILKKNKVPVYKFCDNDIKKQGKMIDGIEVISLQDIWREQEEYFVVIASRRHAGNMLNQLMEGHFPRKNIWYPRLGALYATTGQQYFDCPEMPPVGKDEVFIDVGCFDMTTSKMFAEWSGHKYRRIIAFEPDSYNYENCLKNIDIRDCELLSYAAWGRGEELCFSSAGSGSNVFGTEGKRVKAESIDHVLNGERATFIKMDVEGAELKVLEGTESTIKKYKPRLAICIYHKPDDIYRIPLLLMDYRDDYKFYIRHYTSCSYETVLYAV